MENRAQVTQGLMEKLLLPIGTSALPTLSTAARWHFLPGALPLGMVLRLCPEPRGNHLSVPLAGKCFPMELDGNGDGANPTFQAQRFEHPQAEEHLQPLKRVRKGGAHGPHCASLARC